MDGQMEGGRALEHLRHRRHCKIVNIGVSGIAVCRAPVRIHEKGSSTSIYQVLQSWRLSIHVCTISCVVVARRLIDVMLLRLQHI